MKAVVIRELGDVSVLKVETDYPKPTLALGQALVRNTFAGLNFIDTYYRKGLYKKELPFVAGGEGGGVVEEISPNEKDGKCELNVGDTVAYRSFGSYAEFTAVPIGNCTKVPDGISLEKALAGMVQGLTAHYLTTDACAGLMRSGDWCLIYAVGSGTTQWAAQMAKLQGYRVIGTTSKTKEARARTCGCDELIVLDTAEGKTYADYESVDIAGRVKEITGGAGCHAILDGVGASTAAISVACLARRGIWISFGNASGAVPPISLLSLTPKSAFVTRPKLSDYVTTPEELEERCNDVFGWLKSNKLQVSIDQVFSLDYVQDGHTYLESGKSQGKILFKI
eukprot:CAMPEP_0194028928 /NCGR_PEP_ID=MMETSP0009_2-20130614/2799_1 /TAXON_ID=210454 /ORGANISM="Grammatophora oceanica, Strain CCMP 410" /LENGTH=337 /DNA_ID=CAMNT_0038668465 /DNA_START=32 /DNA_END=1045 /DNA_ORIENTATION=+